MVRAVAAMVLVLAAAPAQAGFTGLALIPTVDTLAPGQYRVEYAVQGRNLLPVGRNVTSAQALSEFGFGLGEVGVDYDVSGDTKVGAILNAKLVARPVSAGLGFAVGTYGIARHQAPTTYAVASAQVSKRTELSIGGQRLPAGTNQGFAGVNQTLTRQLSLFAETIGGSSGAEAVTLVYQVTAPLGTYLAWQHGHSGSGNSLVFNVNYTGRF